MINRFQRIIRMVVRLEYAVSLPLFIGMLALMFVQVVSRYVLQIPMVWSEELVRFMFISVTYLGCAIATQERGHIEINFIESIIDRLIANAQGRRLAYRLINILRDAVTTVLMGFLSFLSIKYLLILMRLGTLSATMMIPLWMVTGIMVLGFVLTMGHAFWLVVLDIVSDGTDGFNSTSGGKQ